MRTENPILSFTGPTCSGKTTILRDICKRYKVSQLVGNTTRDIRPGEVDGIDVLKITKEEFEKGLSEDRYYQHLNFHGVYYGTTWAELDRIIALGEIPAMIVDPTGLASFSEIKKRSGLNHFSVYVDATTETLLSRYFSRETEETLDSKASHHLKRIRGLLKEVQEWPDRFHYSLNVYNEINRPSKIEKLSDKVAQSIGAQLRS